MNDPGTVYVPLEYNCLSDIDVFSTNCLRIYNVDDVEMHTHTYTCVCVIIF